MKINRNNYEAFFLDFFEGSLAPEMESELHLFLSKNPDLAEEFEDSKVIMQGGDVTLTDDIYFEGKENMKKAELPIDQNSLNELLAREVEEALTEQEKTDLNKLEAEYPFIGKSRKAFALTKLQSSSAEAMPDKHGLYVPQSIDLNNPEMLIIAAIEGDLSAKQHAVFNHKIESDPEFKKQFEIFKSTKLKSESSQIEFGNLLFEATPDMNNPQVLLAAKIEGDLTLDENNRLNHLLIRDVKLKNDLDIFYKTKLSPLSEIFDAKDTLRKRETKVYSLRNAALRFVSVAAVLLFVFLIVGKDDNPPAQIASVDTVGSAVALKPIKPTQNEATHKNEAVDTKSVKGNEIVVMPKIVTPSNTEQETIQRFAFNGTKLQSKEASLFEISNTKDIVRSTPDMSMLYADDTPRPAELNNDQNSVTLLSYLGKVASEKLENTYAYSFAEKQYQKINDRSKNEILYEKKKEEDKEEIHIRIGGFELTKPVTRKEEESETILQRVERLYKRLRN